MCAVSLVFPLMQDKDVEIVVWNTFSAAKTARTPFCTVPASSPTAELSNWKTESAATPLPKSHWKQTVPGGTVKN